MPKQIVGVYKYNCDVCGQQLRWNVHIYQNDINIMRIQMTCKCGFEISFPVRQDAPCVGVAMKDEVDADPN